MRYTDDDREIKTLRLERSALITTLQCAKNMLCKCYKEAKRLEENQGSLFDAELEEEIVEYLLSWGLLQENEL